MDPLSSLIPLEDLMIYYGAWGLVDMFMETFNITSFRRRLFFYAVCLFAGMSLVWRRDEC